MNYRCWVATELDKAEKGDWNWNQSLGFRRVSMTDSGEPKRGLERPVAWPGYAGYPPNRDAATGTVRDAILSWL